jgi:hypothetical protein
VLGLDLSIRSYPAGSPVRDKAHLALLGRLRSQVHPSFGWAAEAPVAGTGDLRAWDAMLTGVVRVGVDAETRLSDIPALQRREELKLRDGTVDRLVLLVSATRHNVAVLREHRAALRATVPLDNAAVLPALRAGTDPGGNGLVIL